MQPGSIGILHRGKIGVFLAACLKEAGHAVSWVSEGRSPRIRKRAGKHTLLDAGSIARLCEVTTVIISVCPPEAAEKVAAQVMAHSFVGLYLGPLRFSWVAPWLFPLPPPILLTYLLPPPI